MSDDTLWTQRQAAEFLNVTTRYLRDSSCPRVALPSNVVGGKPRLRYDPAAVRAWAGLRDVKLAEAS